MCSVQDWDYGEATYYWERVLGQWQLSSSRTVSIWQRLRHLHLHQTSSTTMETTSTTTPLKTLLTSLLTSTTTSTPSRPLLTSLYTSLSLLLTSLSLLSLYSVYLILQPFIKPLLWALLCGSVMYPFKRKLLTSTEAYLEHIKTSSVPFTLYLVSSPLIIADGISDKIGGWVWTYWKGVFGGILLFFLSYGGFHYFPVWVLYIVRWGFAVGVDVVFLGFSWVRGDILIGCFFVYIGVIVWCFLEEGRKPVGDPTDQPPTDTVDSSQTPLLARTISTLTWSLTVLYVTKNLPYTILIPVLGFMATATVAYFRARSRESKYTLPKISMMAAKLVLNIGSSTPSRSFKTPEIPVKTPPDSDATDESIGGDFKTDMDEPDSPQLDSNTFLYFVFVACLVVQVWHHPWLTHLLPLPVLYYTLKHTLLYLHLPHLLSTSSTSLSTFYSNPTSNNIFPPPVRTLFRITSIADKKLLEFCECYLNPVASSLTLLFIIILTVLGLTFASVQVYLEGDHLVRVGVDLVNRSVSNPEVNKMLPEGWEGMVREVVNNGFEYGREYVSGVVRDVVEEKSPEKAEEIQIKVGLLWDQLYERWSGGSRGGGVEDPPLTSPLSLSLLLTSLKSTMSLSSLYTILTTNLSLAFSLLTSLLSLLFGGGSALINLSINLTIFLTSLFYLLSSSTSVYKPVELLTTSIPGHHSKRFLSAIEEAVNGVFTASFKMAVFYGMWTFLVHTLFGIEIVFLPSFLAAVFGAVPLLMPYWAVVPAMVELGVKGEWGLAVGVLVAMMAPASVVDAVIYSEIEGGGHPYLTGLAVAGGIFYFGVQGAVLGPVLLCVVVVGVKVGVGVVGEVRGGV